MSAVINSSDAKWSSLGLRCVLGCRNKMVKSFHHFTWRGLSFEMQKGKAQTKKIFKRLKNTSETWFEEKKMVFRTQRGEHNDFLNEDDDSFMLSFTSAFPEPHICSHILAGNQAQSHPTPPGLLTKGKRDRQYL